MTTEPPPRRDRGFFPSTVWLAVASLYFQLFSLLSPSHSPAELTFFFLFLGIGLVLGVLTGLFTVDDRRYPKALAILGLLPVVSPLFFILLPKRNPSTSRGFDVLPPNP
jgi:predicted MFS family arabinose efflux permease